MKSETIRDNYLRLLAFFKMDAHEKVLKSIYNDPTPKLLFEIFSRQLDGYGAPSSGLSLIFALGDDWEEIKKFAEEQDMYYYDSGEITNDILKELQKIDPHLLAPIKPDRMRFLYNGYMWLIQKEYPLN